MEEKVKGEGTDGQGRGIARVINDEEDKVEVEVESSVAGYLLLADTYYPGWRAWGGWERSWYFKS